VCGFYLYTNFRKKSTEIILQYSLVLNMDMAQLHAVLRFTVVAAV
jgi:hypothetical protein